jgi:hypothetical protein
LDDNYHGDALTTTRDAWKAEIEIMKSVVSYFRDDNGQIIFEYDIPRLGKRIDVVLLYRGRLVARTEHEGEVEKLWMINKIICSISISFVINLYCI